MAATAKQMVKRLTRFPTFVTGSARQTMASLAPRRRFSAGGREAVVLVPGAFCTSSVMNGLGRRLESMGMQVILPGNLPYFWGPLANLCPIEDAVREFLWDVTRTARVRGLKKFWLAGHSNGGLIALNAIDMAADEGFPDFPGMVKGVITMATPFRGVDIAPLLKQVIPVCGDIAPDSRVLARAARHKDRVKLCMKSTGDFLVLPEFQSPEGVKPVRMNGFNHMDFFVGSDEQVSKTATLIKECVYGNRN